MTAYGAFEGDLVRPLGFVTLYSAYAESELDELIAAIPADEPYDDSKRTKSVGRKLRYALKLVNGLHSPTLNDLKAILKEATGLFERRNELVHGRLFAGGRLVSNRLAEAERSVSAEDIGHLADEIFNWKDRLNVCKCRQLLPLLESRQPANDA